MSNSFALSAEQPKHLQIAEIIRQEIHSGRLAKGSQLLTDHELAKKYKINRHTVAAGIAKLAAEGLVERAPRRGTIVTGKATKLNVSNAVGVVSMSKGDVYNDLFQIITDKLIARQHYPIVINNSLMGEASHSDECKLKVKTFLNCIAAGGSMPFGFIVDGYLQFPFEYVKYLNLHNIVFILKYHHPERLQPAKYALVDFVEAGRQAASYFIAKGYRKLACLAVEERHYVGEWSSMQVMMLNGFSKECRKHGLECDDTVFWQVLHGAPFKETVGAYLADPKRRPQAFLLYSDSTISFHLLPLLQELRLNYPRDIEFVGFFNTDFSRKYGFPSICVHEEKIAEAALDLLTRDEGDFAITIQPELIVR